MKHLLFSLMLFLSLKSLAQNGNQQLVNPVSKIYTTNEFGRDAQSVTILHGSTVKMPDLPGTAGQVLTKNADGSIGLSTPVAGGGVSATTDTASTSTTQPLAASATKKIINNLIYYLDPADLNPIIDARIAAAGGTSAILTPTYTNQTSTAVTVNWTNVNALYYNLYRYPAGSTTGTLVYTGTAFTYNDTGLTSGTTYSYSVLPVFGSAVTTTVAVDNSQPTPGYTLIQYFDFSDLSKSLPAGNNTQFKNNNEVSGNNSPAAIISSDGPAFSVSNGVFSSTPIPNIKIYSDFQNGKNYKFTFYNGTNFKNAFIQNGGGGDPVQTGNDVVFNLSGGGQAPAYFFFANGSTNITFTAFKLEVQN